MEIGWIDFSPQERERTLTILNALQEPGSVDELGVGIVRDAFADRLFPGTSTLLTKARYFFLTAYLMKTMEQGIGIRRRDSRALQSDYRDLERRCAEGLLACLDHTEGVIGRVSLPRGRWVSRGPGEIYWASLRNLGFMRPGSAASYSSYFSYISNLRMQAHEPLSEADEDGSKDDVEPIASMWNIPKECWDAWNAHRSTWKQDASIDLTEREAVFLKEQITKEKPKSLYALLVSDAELRAIALASQSVDDDEFFGTLESTFHVFMTQAGVSRIEAHSKKLADLCSLADGFSEFVLGCRIAYNMQLAGLEEAGEAAWEQYAPRAVRIADELDIDAIGDKLNLKDHGGFLSLKGFSRRARDAMTTGDLEALKEIVAERERYLKGARAKIGRTDLLDLSWRGGLRLPYRFNQAVSIIREIEQAGGFNA